MSRGIDNVLFIARNMGRKSLLQRHQFVRSPKTMEDHSGSTGKARTDEGNRAGSVGRRSRARTIALRVAGIAFLLLLAVVTLGPVADRPQTGYPVLDRAFAYFVLALLLRLGFRVQTRFLALALMLGIIGLELAQAFRPDRDARALDVLEKIAGALLGLVVAKLIEGWTKGRSHS